MSRPFAIGPYQNQDRTGFTCGNDRIDRFFRDRLSRDLRNCYAHCYVAIDAASGQIAGFYTLSSQHILLDQLPEPLKKKLPPYPTAPAPLLGWLGCDLRHQGRGLGAALLFHALRTVHRSGIGAYAVVTDPIDAQAAAFYERFGFRQLAHNPDEDRPPRLFLPMKDAIPLMD